MAKRILHSPVAVGDTFGRLEVTAVLLSRKGSALVAVRCECSNEREVAQHKLLSGHTKSCGCLRADKASERRTTHGHCRSEALRSVEHRIWTNMKARCSNPKSTVWEHYGGRGITVCPEWQSDFAAFLRDMGARPSPKHSLDRYPDMNGNYHPGNCRWATREEQMGNRRNATMVKMGDEQVCVAEAARRTGIKARTILRRVERGWPETEWLLPADPNRPKHRS